MSGCRDRARPTSHARSRRRPWESGKRELSRPPLLRYHTFTPTFFQTNVLVDSDGTPRIAGLGSASIQSFPAVWSEDPPELTRCHAPELLNPGAFGLPNAQVTEQTDIYAFGVLAYEVAHSRSPF